HGESDGERLPYAEGFTRAAFAARRIHSVMRLYCVLPFRHDGVVGVLHSGIDSPGPVPAGCEALPEKDGSRLSVFDRSFVSADPGRLGADHRYFVCGDAVFLPGGADFYSDELRYAPRRAKPPSHRGTHCRVAGWDESLGGGVDRRYWCAALF